MRLVLIICFLSLISTSLNKAMAVDKDKPTIVRIQTVLRDTRGRTLSDAFCAIYNQYGPPFNLRTNSRGEALLEGHTAAVIRCVKEKQTYEAKMPTGEPTQILMQPLGGGKCFVYNVLPSESSLAGCLSESYCGWSGWGPYGVCSDIPTKE
jgi:hypothetical protein